MLSLQQLLEVCPRAPHDVLEPMNAALEKAECGTRMRAAMFLAQWAHESGQFRYLEELGTGVQYEGRKDLGNIHPGDGPRYRGRGWPQITGAFNYEQLGKYTGLDLLAHPELVAQYPTAASAASWFWQTRNLNAKADQGDILGVTRRINGGENGLEERKAYYAKALTALGRLG